MDLTRLFDVVLTPPLPPDVKGDSFLDWWRASLPVLSDWRHPFERAVVAGLLSRGVGTAFAAGYQAALRRLAPGAAGERDILCLCVTEEEGGHPRAVRTELERHAGGWRLRGHKKWATLGPVADAMLVAARVGSDAEGRPALRVVYVRADRPGVSVARMPPTPFAPEIPHAQLTLDGVPVSQEDLLPGDGYAAYVKPFRTIEDVHVSGAMLGYLLGVAARSSWTPEIREELLGLTAALRTIADAEPAASSTHIALAGFFRLQARLSDAIDEQWQRADAKERSRWERDHAITAVAGKARARRREVAWERMGREAPGTANGGNPGDRSGRST